LKSAQVISYSIDYLEPVHNMQIEENREIKISNNPLLKGV